MPGLGLIGLGAGMAAGILGNRYGQVIKRRLGLTVDPAEDPENRVGLLFLPEESYVRYLGFRHGIPYNERRASLLPSSEDERRVELAQLREWANLKSLGEKDEERREQVVKNTRMMLEDLPPRGRQVLDRMKLYGLATHEGKDDKQLTK